MGPREGGSLGRNMVPTFITASTDVMDRRAIQTTRTSRNPQFILCTVLHVVFIIDSVSNLNISAHIYSSESGIIYCISVRIR
jgi:hypothetical protein